MNYHKSEGPVTDVCRLVWQNKAFLNKNRFRSYVCGFSRQTFAMELHTKWHVRQHLPNVQISYNSKKSPDALFLDSFAISYTVFYFLFKTNCGFWKRLFWTIFISSPCLWKRHVCFRKTSLVLQTRKVPFSCAVYMFF